MKRQSFTYKNMSQTFWQFEEGKMLAPKPTIGGNENHNGSLFKMSNVSGE